MKVGLLLLSLVVSAVCAYAQPALTFSVDTLQFGATALYATNTRTITVVNNTNTQAVAYFNFANSPEFAFRTTDTIVVQGQHSIDIQINYTPTSTQSHSSLLQMWSSSSRESDTLFMFGNGDSTKPNITVSPSTVFLNTTVGSTVTETIVVTNRSVNATTIEAVLPSHAVATYDNDLASTFSLEGFASREFEISYTPTARQQHAEEIVWKQSNSVYDVSTIVNLNGTVPNTIRWASFPDRVVLHKVDQNNPSDSTVLVYSGNGFKTFNIRSSSASFTVSPSQVSFDNAENFTVVITYLGGSPHEDAEIIAYNMEDSVEAHLGVTGFDSTAEEHPTENSTLDFYKNRLVRYHTIENPHSVACSYTINTYCRVDPSWNFSFTPSTSQVTIEPGESFDIEIVCELDTNASLDSLVECALEIVNNTTHDSTWYVTLRYINADAPDGGIRVKASSLSGNVGSTSSVRLTALSALPETATQADITIVYNNERVRLDDTPISQDVEGVNTSATLGTMLSSTNPGTVFATIPFTLLSSHVSSSTVTIKNIVWKDANNTVIPVTTTVNDVVTDVADGMQSALHLYPSVTSSTITIADERLTPGASIMITDVQGRLVAQHIVGNDNVVIMSLESLPAGVYSVTTTGNTMAYGKVVKL